MAVLNYEGLSYLYSQLVTHFADKNDVTQNFDKVESDIKNINTTLATKQNQTQVQNLIDASINKLVDGAPDALNTLNELAAALGDDKDYYKTINELINGIKNTLNTKANADELGAHVANKANPHEVTIVEEGEGNIVSSFENGTQIVAHKDAYGFSKKEGNIVQENCLEEMPIRVKTVLEPIQSGSGDPYPAGGGKNLLKNTMVSGTQSGITFTVNMDGSITANGTATSDCYRTVCADVGLPAGDYILSGCPTSGGSGKYILYFAPSDAPNVTDAGHGANITVREGQTHAVTIKINNGVTVDNITFHPMIRLASITDATYAPYANIRPISGHTGAKLTKCGKNLLDPSKLVSGYAISSADGTVYSVGSDKYLATQEYIPVNFKGTISISQKMTIVFYDRNKRYLYGTTASTMAVPDGSAFYRIDIHKDGKDAAQIEMSSMPSPFEPYQGKTFSASFGQTVYGGTLDWNTGVLTVDRAIVTLTGTENVQFSSSSAGRFVYYGLQNVIKPFSNSTIVAPIVCSHYKPSTADYLYNTPDAYAIAQNNGTEIWFSDTGFDSPSAFKAYLSAQYAAGTPVQICYKLAEPYTIQLSPHQIKSLKGTNTIYSLDGISSVVFNSESLNYDTTPISIEQTNSLVTVENGLDGYGFKATSIIEPQQAGSGDPYPAGGGKNLFCGTTTTSTSNGITKLGGCESVVTLYGTSNIDFGICVMDEISLNAGTYTFSAGDVGNIDRFEPNINSTPVTHVKSNESYTFTLTEQAKFSVHAIIYGGADLGTQANPTRIEAQLEVGAVATEYEPYSNIRPITGHTGCDVMRSGKNLAEQIVYGYVTLDGDNAYVKIDNNSISVIAGVVEGNEYTISCSATLDRFGVGKLEAANPTNGALLTGYRFYGNQSSVHELHFTADFTGTAFIYLKSTKDDTAKDSLQVEIGSVATEYEPYQGETFSTDFGRNLAKSIYATGYTSIYSNCLYVDTDIKPNTTYTISFIANAENANRVLYLNELLASYQDFRITGARQSVTFTTKESISSVNPVAGKGYIMFKNGTELAAPMTFTDVQLELGSTATDYTPYNTALRAKTGGMVYGGTLDWNKGVLTVDRAKATINSITALDSRGILGLVGNTYDNIVSIDNTYKKPDIISDYLPAYTLEEARTTAENAITQYLKTLYIKVKGCNTLADYQNWIANNPITFIYKLAKPITIQLTPQHLTMLQGKNNFYSNSSTLKIKTNTSIENYYTLESFNLPSVDDFLTKNSIVSIVNGGTGAASAEQARMNLGITPENIGAIKKSGDTMTGAFGFANNTWNPVGDDAYIGDCNQAGMVAIKGKNKNTGLYFSSYNGNVDQYLVTDGSGTMYISGTVSGNFSGNLSGNASTATKLATARTISLTGDVTGSTTFDGNSNVSIAATVANDSHTHSQSTITPYVHNAIGTAGTTGYVKFATLNITNTYANEPIVFELSRRQATTTCTLYVTFASANTTDPELGKFTFIGQDYDCYIYKSATSTWDLYCRKAEGYDQVGVVRFNKPSYMAGTTVTWTSTNASSYPEGATKAVVDGYIATAATATTSNSCSGNASTATKVNNNLTIKLNSGATEGTNLFTFNGSAGKTINITPSAIGAAAASHGTHLSLGTTSSTAFRGDYGNTAYTHSQSAHAPTNAQKNSDITKAEIEAKLTGTITSHAHNYAGTSHGTHVSYGTSASAIAKTASAGSASTVSRSDHVHSLPLNLIYPVGSIYMSVNSTSPATLFGGTWEQIQDKFLLSAGSTYSAGSTGGEARHTLTIDETPAHNHTPLDSAWHFNQTKGGLGANNIARKEVAANNSSSIWVIAQTGGKYDALATTNTTNTVGASGAHNNMPPYLTVYMWKRTA